MLDLNETSLVLKEYFIVLKQIIVIHYGDIQNTNHSLASHFVHTQITLYHIFNLKHTHANICHIYTPTMGSGMVGPINLV